MMNQIKTLLTRLYSAPLMIESSAAHALVSRATAYDPKAQSDDVGRFKSSAKELIKLGNVAVIQVYGGIVQRASAFEEMFFGLTSIEGIASLLNEARNDPTVEHIVLELDTPGGEVSGLFELSQAVADTAQDKPVFAILNESALSAGYAIASGATKIFVPETGAAGSVGVILLHFDQSEALEKAGIKVTEIKAGERKSDGSPFVPLSKSARERLQSRVDTVMDLFVQTVATNRGMTEEAVRATEAGIFFGKEALQVGFADEIGTFDTVMAALVDGESFNQNGEGIMSKKKKETPTAEVETPEVEAQVETPEAEVPATPEPQAEVETPATLTAQEIAEQCIEADAAELIPTMLGADATQEDLDAKLTYAKDVREACTAAGFPKLANGLIKMNVPVDTVRESLVDALADGEQEVSAQADPAKVSEEPSNPILADVEARSAEWNQKHNRA